MPTLQWAWRNGSFFHSNAAFLGTLWTPAKARRFILRAREHHQELPDLAPRDALIPETPLHKREIQATFGDEPPSGSDVSIDKAMRAPLLPERPRESLADLFNSSGLSIKKFGAKRAQAAKRNELEAEALAASREIRTDPAKFAALCRKYDGYLTERAGWHRGERELFDALDRLNEVEDAPKLERARQIVLCWFRSPLSIRGFCRANGRLWPTEFNRLLDSYSEVLAERLTRDQVPVPHVDMVLHSPDIVLGFDNIAEVLGRPLKWVEQHARELPVGLVHDVPCANAQLLRPYAARRSRRPVTEPRPDPQPVVSTSYLGLPPWLQPTATFERLPIELRPTAPTNGKDKRLRDTLRIVYSRARGDALPWLDWLVFKHNDKDLGRLYCSVDPLLKPLAEGRERDGRALKPPPHHGPLLVFPGYLKHDPEPIPKFASATATAEAWLRRRAKPPIFLT